MREKRCSASVSYLELPTVASICAQLSGSDVCGHVGCRLVKTLACRKDLANHCVYCLRLQRPWRRSRGDVCNQDRIEYETLMRRDSIEANLLLNAVIVAALSIDQACERSSYSDRLPGEQQTGGLRAQMALRNQLYANVKLLPQHKFATG